MADLTHWKKLQNPNYLGAYSLLPGQELILTIKSVGLEMVVGTDGKKEECTVARFAENCKPMILNATNCKTIAKLYDTPYIEEWADKRIQVYATKVKAFGEEVEALRVRPKEPPPAQKRVFNQEHKKWGNAIAALEKGETTLADIQKRFTIPDDCITILAEAQKKCQKQDT